MNDILIGSTEGNEAGDFAIGSKAILQEVKVVAESILNNINSTITELSNAKVT